MGVFVYVRVGGALLASIDQSLRAQAVESIAHARPRTAVARPRLGRRATSSRRCSARTARVVRARRRPASPPLLDARPSCSASPRARVAATSRDLPGCDERLAAARDADRCADGRRSSSSRSSLERARRDARPPARELLFAAARSRCCSRRSPATGSPPPRCARSRRCAAGRRRSRRRRRAPAAGAPSRDEISRLAETLNDMLARLEAAFEHERRFVADASHELRTPLALLRTELELALRRPRSREELEQALRSAAEETERLTPARRGPAADRALRPGRAADPPRAASPRRAARRRRRALRRRARSCGPDARRSAGRRSACSTPTRRGSSRRSGTSSTTRSPTAPARSSSRLDARDGRVELHVADEGPGFPPDVLRRARSTASAAPTSARARRQRARPRDRRADRARARRRGGAREPQPAAAPTSGSPSARFLGRASALAHRRLISGWQPGSMLERPPDPCSRARRLRPGAPAPRECFSISPGRRRWCLHRRRRALESWSRGSGRRGTRPDDGDDGAARRRRSFRSNRRGRHAARIGAGPPATRARPRRRSPPRRDVIASS